jgi:hypothetical protein
MSFLPPIPKTNPALTQTEHKENHVDPKTTKRLKNKLKKERATSQQTIALMQKNINLLNSLLEGSKCHELKQRLEISKLNKQIQALRTENFRIAQLSGNSPTFLPPIHLHPLQFTRSSAP